MRSFLLWLSAFGLLSCQLISGGADLEVGVLTGGAGGAAAGGSAPGGAGGSAGGMGGSGGAGGAGGMTPTGACNAALVSLGSVDGDGSKQVAQDVAPMPEGGCVVVGEFVESFDLTPWGGASLPGTIGTAQPFALRIDADGSFMWGVPIEDPEMVPPDDEENTYRTALHVEVNGSGEIFVGGLAADKKVFVVNLAAASGAVLWGKELEGSQSIGLEDMVVEGEDIWVAGACYGQMGLRVPPAATELITALPCPVDQSYVLTLRQDAVETANNTGERWNLRAPSGVLVRALAVDGGLTAIVGNYGGSELELNQEVISDALANGTDGFFVVVEDTGALVYAGTVTGDGLVDASAVALRGDALVVGGEFVETVGVGSFLKPAPSTEVFRFGYLASFELGVTSSAPTGLLVLGDADASIGDLSIEDDGAFLVAGLFEGQPLGGRISLSGDKQPYVLRTNIDGDMAEELAYVPVFTEVMRMSVSTTQVFVATAAASDFSFGGEDFMVVGDELDAVVLSVPRP